MGKDRIFHWPLCGGRKNLIFSTELELQVKWIPNIGKNRERFVRGEVVYPSNLIMAANHTPDKYNSGE